MGPGGEQGPNYKYKCQTSSPELFMTVSWAAQLGLLEVTSGGGGGGA